MKLSMLVYVRKYTCLASAKYQKENIRHMAKLIIKYGTLTPFGENCFTNKAFSLIKSFFLFWVFLGRFKAQYKGQMVLYLRWLEAREMDDIDFIHTI